jgi:haloalkane dehalogenase
MPSEDWKSLYPFASRELRIDGRRYHYLDEGAGPTLLLVHGNPTWSFYWRNLVLGLRGRCRLIVPDHLGCGLSDKPADFFYRLADHIGNLRRLIETLDLKDITLVAHDWGGAIGLGAAVEMPQRFSRFVLMNTSAFRSRRMPWRIAACRIPWLGTLAVRGFNAFARAATFMAVERPLAPAVKAGHLAPYRSWRDRIAIDRFVKDIPLSVGHPSHATLADIETGLPQLRDRPWMFVWGMRDWCFTPDFLERFLEFIPNAKVHRVEDAGHYVVEDAHERIVPWIAEFLAASAEQSPADATGSLEDRA